MPSALSATDLTPEHMALWRLIRTPNVGPVTVHRLLQRYGSATAALAELPSLVARLARPTHADTPTVATEAEVMQEFRNLLQIYGIPIFFTDDAYPKLLRHIPDAPPLLHCLGNADFLSDAAVAMVGTRNPSASGFGFAQDLARGLAQNLFLVVSGLARGIDTACHQGCLQGEMPTIAVVAGGVDHLYPPENAHLREQIIAHGCVLSEAPLGAIPSARHFPRRNRIIAGMARLTIVTEATRNSGSLITASYALDYGREVYAVPGSPQDPRAAGPNHLLKQGAHLLESVEDILGNPALTRAFQPAPIAAPPTPLDLFPTLAPATPAAPAPLNTSAEAPQTAYMQLFALLSNVPIMPDDLLRQFIQQSGLPEADAMVALADLELDGKLKRQSNGALVRG